jgi:sporulation protein YlmC with PRC-barrel domain
MTARLTRTAAAALIGAPLLAGSAASQDAGSGSAPPLDTASKLISAAKSLSEVAKDALLIKDLLGLEVAGADGKSLGTVENFAVAPGGRLIAALLELKDGGRMIALPAGAIKLASAAQGGSLDLLVPASDVTSAAELESLAGALAN